MDHNFTKHLLKKTTYGHFNTSYWDRLSVAQDGTLFVSDHLHHTIKRVTRCGLVETYAGMSDDWGWRDGDCREALFKFPFVVLCDSRGVVYVGEEATVRKITPDGVVTTIAGGSEVGLSDGPLGESMVNGVISMAMDRHEQSLFFVDYWNNRIRCIDLKSYVVSSLKNGDSYDFYDTTAVAVSRDGKDIYIARTYHEYSLVVLKDYRNNNQLTRFPVQYYPINDIKITSNFRLPDQPQESQFLLFPDGAVSLDNPKVTTPFRNL